MDAHLVDCEMARKRKAEFNLLSPADLMKIFGPAVLDESIEYVSLKELPITHSELGLCTVNTLLRSGEYTVGETIEKTRRKTAASRGGSELL